MANGGEAAVLRIGELARRVGVSQDVLRAWERRYGLLMPVRSSGGFRLYTSGDERRVRRMQSHLARGLAPAEAARAVLNEEAEPSDAAAAEPAADDSTRESSESGRRLTHLATNLRRALDMLDEPAAQGVLDELFANFTVETIFREVLLPYLRDLGDRWAQDAIGVGTEHFASNLLRARLASLARGWGQGRGPCAVLACPPGELHDLPLLTFGIVLHRNGWRIVYLGADTPLSDLRLTVEEKHPEAVVLAAVDAERFQESSRDLIALAQTAPLRLAGAGATAALAEAVGARMLHADPVTEAQRLIPEGAGQEPPIREPGGITADNRDRA